VKAREKLAECVGKGKYVFDAALLLLLGAVEDDVLEEGVELVAVLEQLVGHEALFLVLDVLALVSDEIGVGDD
jgi:hypothetical protein